LLDDLLDSSRISEGKIAMHKEVVDLEGVLRRAVLSTEHAFHERHQSLATVYPRQPLFVEGDPIRLEQVFTNLLTNASKYSPSGERVEIILRATDGKVVVHVKDKGVGIEAETMEHIFKPFYQSGKASAVKKGLGIGLALVRGFVTMHGGTIQAVSSGPGKGSEFIVTLPTTTKTTPRTSQEILKKEPGPKTSGLRILVVDDNDAAGWGVGRLLELRGCTIAFAYDGAKAIEQAEEFKPDIILLDISLPDQDGYTVAKILRTQGYKGRIIGLTGYSTEEAKVKGERAGFDAYLVKPAGLAELATVIPEIG
jgi:CheY-like chemotaxis protein